MQLILFIYNIHWINGWNFLKVLKSETSLKWIHNKELKCGLTQFLTSQTLTQAAKMRMKMLSELSRSVSRRNLNRLWIWVTNACVLVHKRTTLLPGTKSSWTKNLSRRLSFLSTANCWPLKTFALQIINPFSPHLQFALLVGSLLNSPRFLGRKLNCDESFPVYRNVSHFVLLTWHSPSPTHFGVRSWMCCTKSRYNVQCGGKSYYLKVTNSFSVWCPLIAV